MAVTSTARWNGGSREAVLALAKKVKPIHAKYGGDLRLGQVHTGPHAGQWLFEITYPNWETHAKATDALAKDEQHRKLRHEMSGISHMDDRVIVVSYDF